MCATTTTQCEELVRAPLRRELWEADGAAERAQAPAEAAQKHTEGSRGVLRSVSSLAQHVWILTAAAYVMWVLAGTVAWVSHLGERVPWLGAWLPAWGYPSNKPAKSIVWFLAHNVPNSLVFVLPHTLLSAQSGRLKRMMGMYGRLGYNVISALTLHYFLKCARPLQTPVVMIMPLPATAHACLSIGCLVFALIAMMKHPQTWSLLGVTQPLGWNVKVELGMDAITWMGQTVWELGGPLAFVGFTGVSILPAKLTLGDCIIRGVAAFYLRMRSPSFRAWVERIESVHLLTWIIRGFLLLGTLLVVPLRVAACIVAGGVVLMGVLHWAEKKFTAKVAHD